MGNRCLILIAIFFVFSCGKSTSKKIDKDTSTKDASITLKDTSNQTGEIIPKNENIPEFNKDTAYFFIKKQLSFGPRVPNTSSHKACGDYLIRTLKKYADNVIIQPATVTAYNGQKLKIRNIMAQFAPEKSHRILLMAHWDTRPYADMDKDPNNQKKPIPGADDGASGVAVLLEIARQLHKTMPNSGVDIVLFDGEDYGAAKGKTNTFCLGSQYFSKHPPIVNYYASYGILLDMVGAQNARFCMEGWSMKFAHNLVQKVWAIAGSLGYGKYFIYKEVPAVVDDHYFVNINLNIPSIDIINYDNSRSKNGFPAHWHTMNDNIKIIDKKTLKAVGQTVLHSIFTLNF